jgi:thiamine kinase-like enzyme
MQTGAPFTAETTRESLLAACRAVRLDPRGAELVRMGENALYRLQSAPIMVRVGRSVEASKKETEVARWLTANRFPAVSLTAVEQPVVVQGMAVTFWEFIEESDVPATSADLGHILKNLHALPEPTELALPPFEPLPKFDERILSIGSRLDVESREFLTERRDELEARFLDVKFELEPGPIHGDAHRHNLIRESCDQNVKLIDLEDFCVGPREWDLCVEAIGFRTFGWITEDEYEAYVGASGFDALNWSGYPVMQSIRELNMTTWLAQNLGQSKDVDVEVYRRIEDLRHEDAAREWRTF